MDHAVDTADGHGNVFDNRKRNLRAEPCLDIFHPRDVGVETING